ncbi:MAG: DUF6746 family protein [Rhodocyclaceae bacterium]
MNLKHTLTCFALAAGLALAPATHSADTSAGRVAHFEAARGDTLDETMANLKEANRKLAELLAGEVDDHAMHDIHSLSYTLEESLLRIIDELRLLHDTAADMHFATEGLKRDAVIDYGEAYLSGIRKIVD